MSKTAEFTPGPWRLGSHGPNMCPTVGTANGLMVAMVAHGDNHPTQANAHLIAAAPELYEALAKAEGWVNYLRINGCDGGAVVASLAKIRAALAKARGESA